MHVLTFLILMFASALATAAELRDVRVLDGPDATRVVFDLDAESTPVVFTLPNPHRVVVDLRNARRGASMPASGNGRGHVRTVRTGVRDDGMRVVLDVDVAVQPQFFVMAPAGGYGHRLIVDLYPPKPVPLTLPPPVVTADTRVAAVAPLSSAPVPAAPAPALAAAPAVAVAAAPSPAVQPARVRVEDKEIVVAVDAGHGGKDPGAIGLRGLREKDVTLAIARRLARRIDAEPGMRSVLIRDDDTYVDLRRRTMKARKANADLFVSIHANAYHNRAMSGSAVYVLSPHGASSEQARWIAQHENAADLVGGVELNNKDEDLAAVLIDIAQSATMEASFDLGSRLLDSMQAVHPLQKAQVQQAPFMVLKSPDIPSVLVETAFISNPHEERLLGDPKYQEQMARSIHEGVRSYFMRYRPQQIAAQGRSEARAERVALKR